MEGKCESSVYCIFYVVAHTCTVSGVLLMNWSWVIGECLRR